MVTTIARIWKGTVPAPHAEGFFAHLLATGVAEAEGLDGYLGATITRRTDRAQTKYTLTTFWRDVESMRKFGNSEDAVLYPGDEVFDLKPDLRVTVQEVLYRR